MALIYRALQKRTYLLLVGLPLSKPLKHQLPACVCFLLRDLLGLLSEAQLKLLLLGLFERLQLHLFELAFFLADISLTVVALFQHTLLLEIVGLLERL